MPQDLEPKPPRIDRLRATDLVEAAERLRAGQTRDGERFDQPGIPEAGLRGLHLAESMLSAVDAPALAAPRSSWRRVELTGSRLGSVELYESTWRSVIIADTKINYLNARTATWTDVIFHGCMIEELDLAYATVSRLRFADCSIGTLDVSGSRLTDVDLRAGRLGVIKGLAGLAGAWINAEQLTRLAPALAAHLQIRVG